MEKWEAIRYFGCAALMFAALYWLVARKPRK